MKWINMGKWRAWKPYSILEALVDPKGAIGISNWCLAGQHWEELKLGLIGSKFDVVNN